MTDAVDEGSRLRAAARMVPRGARVADIGSGHGLLPRLLLETDRATHCIATERTPETLALIPPLPAHLPYVQRLERRAGDGLEVLSPDDRIDVAILLGMGTRTILRILDSPTLSALSLSRFIFQTQTDAAELRRGLVRRGLGICDERLVRDRGRIYLLIAAEPSDTPEYPAHPTLSDDDLFEVGPLLVASPGPLTREVWQAERRRLESISKQATQGQKAQGTPGGPAQKALAQALRILAALENR